MSNPLAVLSGVTPPKAACDFGAQGRGRVAEGAGGEDFWQRPLGRDRAAGMRAKYAALDGLIDYAEDGPGRARLRAAASRWPGCLREAELVAPDRLRLRAEAVERVLADAGPLRVEHAWPPGPLLAAILADDLHTLLQAQLQPRRLGLRDVTAETVIARSSEVFPWPDPQTWRRFAGARVRPRAAYLWLAAWSGLGMVALQYCLFERRGHWELRKDDPEWARRGTDNG